MTKIFITGFHRAGTHATAMKIAEQNSSIYLPEETIKWDRLDAAEAISNGYIPKWRYEQGQFLFESVPDRNLIDRGFVLQCPGLSHKTLSLCGMGQVVWCDRDKLDIITSMRNAAIDVMAWHIMNNFHDEFPDDPIWKILSYDGSEDVYYSFVEYYSLLVKVKQHFFDTKFKTSVTYSLLDSQPWYDKTSTTTELKPLKQTELSRVSL